MISVLDLRSAPSAIDRLVKWLTDSGFTVTEERASDRNNQFAVFTGGDRTVKVTASRGEWSLGIGISGITFHPEQWEAWLEGYPLAGDLATIEQQVEFITQRWDTAVQQLRENHGAEEEIAAIGDDWVERRFGFRPPKPTG